MTPEAGGWRITLTEPANSVTFPVGAGTWAVSEPADEHGDIIPVAASGGWLDDRTLRAEVIFLETPHRMDITCSRPARNRHGGVAASPAQHEPAARPALPRGAGARAYREGLTTSALPPPSRATRRASPPGRRRDR